MLKLCLPPFDNNNMVPMTAPMNGSSDGSFIVVVVVVVVVKNLHFSPSLKPIDRRSVKMSRHSHNTEATWQAKTWTSCTSRLVVIRT